ncbi:MAG: TetR/AcrR family transcriptional regulator [Bacillota bacterium]
MERTRKRIITAAIELFDEYGIEETTMEQIAEKADVARGTLYNYFSSREEIIGEFIEQSFKEKKTIRFQDLLELSDTRARIEYIFNQLISGIQNKKDLFEKFLVHRMQIMLSFEGNEEGKGNFSLLGYKIIEIGQENGEIRKDIPIYILEDLFEFAFVEAVKPLYIEMENYNQNESIKRCVDLFVNGVKPPG